MSADTNGKPFSGFRNPLLYTSTLLLIALVYVGGDMVDPSESAAFSEFDPIGVEKSAYHHLSHSEIVGGNPCWRHLFGRTEKMGSAMSPSTYAYMFVRPNLSWIPLP
jgi:hypothetical protein